MKQSLKLLPVLIFMALVASCTSKTKNEVDWDVLLYNIEALSILAATCLEHQSRKSEACLDFVTEYKSNGADNMKLFSENVTEFLNKDLEAALITTQQIIVISDAFLFMAGHNKPL